MHLFGVIYVKFRNGKRGTAEQYSITVSTCPSIVLLSVHLPRVSTFSVGRREQKLKRSVRHDLLYIAVCVGPTHSRHPRDPFVRAFFHS